jgi:type I restriction enzyme S subunit
MSEWKEYKLKSFAEVQNGYAFKASDFAKHGVPIIKIKNIQPPNISFEDAQYFNGQIDNRLKQFFIFKKDILISMTGSHVSQISSAVGKVGRYGFDSPALLNQRVGKIYSNDETKLNNDYLYYLIARPEVQFELATNAGGSANQANISPQNIKNLEFKIPDIKTQTRIASILSSLDDKIELNRRMNQTLEQMAKALFNHYFVDNIDPDNLPEGWGYKKVSSFFDINIGRTPPRVQREWFTKNLDDVKWISIKDMGNCGVYIFDTSEYLTKEAVLRFNVPKIPNNTVILSFKLTVGRVSITTEEMLSNEAIAHFNQKDHNHLTPFYTYLFLKQFDYNSLGNTSSIATAVNSQTIKNIDILVPSEKIVAEFSDNVEAIFLKIRENTKETRTLVNLRDTLLPKLMSGEIDVDKK